MRVAKARGIAVLLVGHVTKEGALAGPRVLEHLVDCVLQFEGERERTYRTLRALKNRFGSTNEAGVFEMRDGGLVEVLDASARFVGEATRAPGWSCWRRWRARGRCWSRSRRSSRRRELVPPRRRRHRHRPQPARARAGRARPPRAAWASGTADVFVNVVGGVRVDEPGADLAVALAVASARARRRAGRRGRRAARVLRRDRADRRAAHGRPRRPPRCRGAEVRPAAGHRPARKRRHRGGDAARSASAGAAAARARRRLGLRLGQPLDQLVPLHLARPRARDRVDCVTLAGTLNPARCSPTNALTASASTSSRGVPRRPPAPRRGPSPAAPPRRRRRRPRRERLLDLGRVDVLAAPDDQLFGAAADPQVTVAVAAGEIAGAVPPVHQHGGGRLGQVVVAGHDVRALYQISPSSPGITSCPCAGSTSRTVSPGSGNPHDPVALLPWPVHRDHRRRLGDAVPVEQANAEGRLELLVESGGQDRAGRDADAQLGGGEALVADAVQQVVEHRRDPGKHGDVPPSPAKRAAVSVTEKRGRIRAVAPTANTPTPTGPVRTSGTAAGR